MVRTDTEALRASRKLTLELLLSNHAVDCHHCLRIGSSRCDDLDPKFCEWCFFCDCVKDGFCQLQALAREYKVDKLPFEQKHNTLPEDKSSVIVRNPRRTAEADTLGLPRSAGRYERLLGEAAWSMDKEPESFEEKGLRCVICHNLGQACKAIDEAGRYDVIRVIA